MKNKLTHVAMFVAGAALGAGAACLYFKKKYERIANEEIASVKEMFVKKEEKTDEDNEKVEKEEETDSNKQIYTQLIHDYVNYSNSTPTANIRDEEKPYVIRPEEFGEVDGYEEITLIYYADGYLADENLELIEGDDIDDTVGADFASHFGEYEDDSVFIRNDYRECDYEILMSARDYEEDVQWRKKN